MMRTTRVFMSGNSQAVRLPVDFQFSADEVEIFRRRDEVVIREKPKNLARAFNLLTEFPSDFFIEKRQDDISQARDF